MKFYCYGALVVRDGEMFVTSGVVVSECEKDAEKHIGEEADKDKEKLITLTFSEVPIEFLLENISQDTLINALHPDCRK